MFTIRTFRSCFFYIYKWKFVEVISLSEDKIRIFLFNKLKIIHRSNLSQRFSFTDNALNNMADWSEVLIPIIKDDDNAMKQHQVQQPYSLQLTRMNLTEFRLKLNEFRYVKKIKAFWFLMNSIFFYKLSDEFEYIKTKCPIGLF